MRRISQLLPSDWKRMCWIYFSCRPSQLAYHRSWCRDSRFAVRQSSLLSLHLPLHHRPHGPNNSITFSAKSIDVRWLLDISRKLRTMFCAFARNIPLFHESTSPVPNSFISQKSLWYCHKLITFRSAACSEKFMSFTQNFWQFWDFHAFATTVPNFRLMHSVSSNLVSFRPIPTAAMAPKSPGMPCTNLCVPIIPVSRDSRMDLDMCPSIFWSNCSATWVNLNCSVREVFSYKLKTTPWNFRLLFSASKLARMDSSIVQAAALCRESRERRIMLPFLSNLSS